MDEKKPQVKAKPPAKKESTLRLDWLAIGREVEDVLGDEKLSKARRLLRIYPTVKRFVVKPLREKFG